MTRARATLRTVAQAAEVSVTTVSRVVNGSKGVSFFTRSRVEQVMRQLQYSHGGNSTEPHLGPLQAIVDDFGDPAVLDVLKGVESVAQASGAGMFVAALQGRAVNPRWLTNMTARQPSSMVLITSRFAVPSYSMVRGLGVPVVVADLSEGGSAHTPAVGASNSATGTLAVHHLLSLGHRRVGFVAAAEDLSAGSARLVGYREALRAAGVPADEELVQLSHHGSDAGLSGGIALLDRPDPPTAIFAAGLRTAIGVFQAAARRGLSVPADLSVVGYDDLAQAWWLSPTLTRIRRPLADMGALAAQTAVRLANGEYADQRVDLPTELLIMDSTAAPFRSVAGG
ncbi:substrate-binding domain-containing protein [Actinoplanes sp. NPDC049118]|uniref:LacI family DNA-binding transcriptional regulator n=1 Tax=Actinoplanes sp. NPDC049118 TaxID=3155769 RepID=UPI0033DC452A